MTLGLRLPAPVATSPDAVAHSPADIVLKLLVDLLMVEYSPSLDWQGNVNSEPDSPDKTVTVYDTAGRQWMRGPDSTRVEHPGIQVRVRSGAFQEGFNKARAIANAMDAALFATVVLEGISYLVHGINRTTSVLPIGKEAPTSKRQLFTVNGTLVFRKLP